MIGGEVDVVTAVAVLGLGGTGGPGRLIATVDCISCAVAVVIIVDAVANAERSHAELLAPLKTSICRSLFCLGNLDNLATR